MVGKGVMNKAHGGVLRNAAEALFPVVQYMYDAVKGIQFSMLHLVSDLAMVGCCILLSQ